MGGPRTRDSDPDDGHVAADGRTIDRVALPWSSTDAAKAWYKIGTLEVRLRPAEDDGGAVDES